MKVYCGNSGLCRRKLLLKEFVPEHNEVSKPNHSTSAAIFVLNSVIVTYVVR